MIRKGFAIIVILTIICIEYSSSQEYRYYLELSKNDSTKYFEKALDEAITAKVLFLEIFNKDDQNDWQQYMVIMNQISELESKIKDKEIGLIIKYLTKDEILQISKQIYDDFEGNPGTAYMNMITLWSARPAIIELQKYINIMEQKLRKQRSMINRSSERAGPPAVGTQ
jgi:hypothetical protein